MSDDNSPLTTLFELQHNTIKQTEAAVDGVAHLAGHLQGRLEGVLGLLDCVALQLEQGREGGIVVAHDWVARPSVG